MVNQDKDKEQPKRDSITPIITLAL